VSTYKIAFQGKAARQIQMLPPEYLRLVRDHMRILEHTPRPPGAKKLAGGMGYSLRVGVYRILYDVDDRRLQITIRRVKHRRDVYR
jgi:mRNA interferase RelE/StbE